MDKYEFKSSLQELMGTMTEEEIEKAIDILNNNKAAVYMKENHNRGEEAKFLSTADRIDSDLYYIIKRRDGTLIKDGILKTLGASNLTKEDHYTFANWIPEIKRDWWLYDGYWISDNGQVFAAGWHSETTHWIRPILIIDEIIGNLHRGESFQINDESFVLISDRIAIRTMCLEDKCTFLSGSYDTSVLKYCVNGWYFRLVHENEKKYFRELKGSEMAHR